MVCLDFRRVAPVTVISGPLSPVSALIAAMFGHEIVLITAVLRLLVWSTFAGLAIASVVLSALVLLY